jgi:signal transduction histidine kinase
MSAQRRTIGFGPRLLLAQVLVILAGSITLLGVALLLAPGLFRTHIEQSAGPIPDDLAPHLQAAFARAMLTSLLIGVLAAVLTGLAVSWYITRRVVDPMTAMARAAAAVADGHYGARVTESGLGSEFDAVGRSFNQMARDLAATERTRAEVLRDLAHELRTPLTTIRGYHEALADGVLPASRENFATIEAELSRVQRLIDDLSRVAAAEEGRAVLHRQPVRVTDLLTSAIAAAAPTFNRAGVALSLNPLDDGVVLVDPDRLQEVLANLLNNALRHTPAGGQVTLGAVSSGQTVQLNVTDTGDGITAEHLPRVFERFYRIDSDRADQHGGSGIGLAITRALVQAHDGRVQAHSAGPGKGSTFTITLPTATPLSTDGKP